MTIPATGRSSDVPAPRRVWLGVLSFVGLAVAGLIVLGVIERRAGPVPFALGVALALIPVPLLAAGLLALDRYEPEPRRLLLFTFVWGATVAALIALVLNTADLLALRALLDDTTANMLTASLGAPIFEECAKGAVLVGLLRMRRHEFDGPIDGIVYGGLVGLGFAMTENVLYYSSAAVHTGMPGLVGTFLLRGVFSPFLHPLFTAATGIGLGYAALARPGRGRWLPPAAGLLVAIGLHATWNTAAGHRHLVSTYLFVVLPVFVAVLAVAQWERRRIVRLIQQVLPMYVQSGLLAPADPPMVSSAPARRRARAFLARTRGPAAARALRDFQHAATELALLHDRAARGQLDAAAFGSRREALLRVLVAARIGFSGPTRRPALR
ncbi:MAG: PrsW family intramembrane metalloprotease [Actinomycetota bacterium]|nr:PrsW family intramembrane metalloprotease [Actinomycetota bacterium]